MTFLPKRLSAAASKPDVYVSNGSPEPEIPGGCQIISASTGRRCVNPGRHVMGDAITCTTHRKALERAAIRASS